MPYIPEHEYFAALATVNTSTGALIRDSDRNILIVKPSYRPYWQLPGGMVEDGEAPADGCSREVTEETGLRLAIDRLLVVDWAAPRPNRPKPCIHFMFSTGELTDPAQVQVADDEIEAWQLVPPELALTLVSPRINRRLTAALAVLTDATPVAYLADESRRPGTLL